MLTEKHRDRWTEMGLSPDERPKIMYRYWVTGNGAFPLDMLRYDCAWPATGEDADKMAWTYPQPDGNRIRSIRLHGYRPPTVERWSSFLWSPSAILL